MLFLKHKWYNKYHDYKCHYWGLLLSNREYIESCDMRNEGMIHIPDKMIEDILEHHRMAGCSVLLLKCALFKTHESITSGVSCDIFIL